MKDIILKIIWRNFKISWHEVHVWMPLFAVKQAKPQLSQANERANDF